MTNQNLVQKINAKIYVAFVDKRPWFNAALKDVSNP